MAKAIAGIIVLALTMGGFGPVLAGDWTTHGFIYKPSMGARGTVEKGRYDSGQDRVDARLSKEIWVGDPNYGTTIQAALTAIGSNEAILRVPAGTYSISSNLTVPSNVTLRVERNASLAIPTGVTLTINGGLEAGFYQIFACTGTGKVVFGRVHRTRELWPQWWGAKADGATDDITALQAMVNCSVDSGGLPMFLPGGVYKISDTVKLNLGVNYAGFTFRGAGSSPASDGFTTTLDATGFGDRPAINIQGARRVVVEDIRVVGKNVAPNTASGTLDPTLANWISAGCTDSRYAPYAGISIDAYQGVKPSGGYNNDPYGRFDSSYVMLRNVVVTNFVVGLCIAPCDVSLDSDAVTVAACQIYNNTYGYSCGSSQSRSIVFSNTDVYGNWCSFTTMRHGQQIGNCPSIYNGIFQNAWKLFEVGAANGNNAKTISGMMAESFGWLGDLGTVDSAGSEPTTFVGCHFTWPGSIYEPFFFTANSPLHFDSCHFDGYGTRQLFNFTNGHRTRFTNCSFKGFIDSINVFFGLAENNNYMTYGFDGCEVEQAAYTDSGFYLAINNDFKDLTAFSARRFIAPWTHTARLWAAYGFTDYKVAFDYRVISVSDLSVSGVSISGTNHNAVLTFTAANANDFRVGDVLLWNVAMRNGLGNLKVPAFKVTNKNGSTITANSMVDNVVVSDTPTTVRVVIPLFFNATESTGNTHGTTTVDNVTNIGNWKVGDWIRGAGIDWDTRITNIVGTTITLSKAATATATGVALYNCRLSAM
jgi:hypothetical protein